MKEETKRIFEEFGGREVLGEEYFSTSDRLRARRSVIDCWLGPGDTYVVFPSEQAATAFLLKYETTGYSRWRCS